MKSTLPVLILTAFTTSVFAIEQITATESAACSAAECSSCEKGCTCEKPCCQNAEAAAAKPTSPSVTATAVLTPATTTICGETCDGGQCACSKQGATAAATACAPPATATWTAATTEFAFVTDASADSSACCDGQSECSATCCHDKCECSAACAAELQRTGLDPYRIEPPDALTIYLPALEVSCPEMKQELTACGVLTDAQLPFVGKKTEQVVQPDGFVTIEGIGKVYVAGMTQKDAEQAIKQRAITAHPQAARAAFGVFINVPEKNSKNAYIIFEDALFGDRVTNVPATTKSTVGSVLQDRAWPQPIDFASSRIWIARPASNGVGCETILPVTWNAGASQPTCETNHAVLPGDRLFVKASPEPALPVPPAPVAEFPVLSHPIQYFVPAEYPNASITIDTSAAPPVIRYSAIPAAAPSPFSLQPSVIQASPVVTALPPLPQPPEPSTQPPFAADFANRDADSWARDGCNVEFTIAVIEDVSGSFNEFPKLRDGMIMISDSDATLAAVRIMENQKLVKQIASPQIKCVVGEQATFCLASACDCDCTAAETESLSVQVKAREPGQSSNGTHMFLETGVQASCGRQIRQVQLAYRIEEGQSAILKTRHQPRPGSTDEGHAVYVVVTPKLVK